MKKRFICAALSLAMILGCSSFAFATEEPTLDTTITAVADATMEFSGKQISLSIDDAIKRMQTEGTAAEGAQLLKDSFFAASKTSSEAISRLKSVLGEDGTIKDNSNGLSGKQAKLAKSYYSAYSDIAYAATLNGLEATTVQLYYGILQAEENYRISQETTKVKDALYNNTKLKYNLGEVAKIDLLQAESAKLNAVISEESAKIALISAKMSFNQVMGYDLMQDVKLTSKLEMTAAPAVSLTDAINSALKNRHEILTAKYNAENSKLTLDSYHAYPKSSATYLNALVSFNKSKLAYENTVKQVEMGIRTSYINLETAKNNVAKAQSSVQNAKEAARIYEVQYQTGMCTMDQLQEMQNTAYLAEIGVAQAITNYNIAVYNFEYSMNYGTL